LRDQAITDAKKRDGFDIAFEAVFTGLENVRTACADVGHNFTDHERQMARGEKVRVSGGIIQIEGPIDRELRKATDELISTTGE